MMRHALLCRAAAAEEQAIHDRLNAYNPAQLTVGEMLIMKNGQVWACPAWAREVTMWLFPFKCS